MFKRVKRMRRRIKRAVKRLRKHAGGKSWKKTPSAWLVYFLASAALPVMGGSALLAFLVPELWTLIDQHGTDQVGAVLWAFAVLMSVYVWLGGMVMKRCNELLCQRWLR